MSDNKKEPKLTFALDVSGKMVSIKDITKGSKCVFRCPKCNDLLSVKIGNGKRQPHFAHKANADCNGSYMTALHKLAVQILEEEKAVMAPEYKEIKEKKLSFKDVEVERRVDRKDLQPDLVGITEDNLRWAVEIRNTHEVDEAKKAKLIESGITCLEIDVSDQKLENLRTFLLESSEKRVWINNPIYEALIAEAKRKKISQIENYLLNKPVLAIPEYSYFESKIICLDDASVMLKSDDGLFVRIRAITSVGTPYIFNVGIHEVVIEKTLHKKRDCNELEIFADNLSVGSNISSSNLIMSWLFHSDYAKNEEKLEEYKRNTNYLVRLKKLCSSQCVHKPSNRECECIIETIPQKDGLYVVCDYGKRRREEEDAANVVGKPNNVPINIASHSKKNNNQEKELFLEIPLDEIDKEIKECYEQLESSGLYKTATGEDARIVKCEIVRNRIIVLYKVVRNGFLYHIDVLYSENGNRKRNEVADFGNNRAALDSYHQRLSIMRKK
jgi:hypothetical protein